MGLLGAVALSVPREARAQSGSFLETIGVSIAVGTVLGASTLPFYDQPGKHVMNMAYGASAGAIVGLGVLVYGLLGPSQDEASLAGRVSGEVADAARRKNSVWPEGQAVSLSAYSVRPALWTPLVSLSW
jgi:hypothetical protein